MYCSHCGEYIPEGVDIQKCPACDFILPPAIHKPTQKKAFKKYQGKFIDSTGKTVESSFHFLFLRPQASAKYSVLYYPRH